MAGHELDGRPSVPPCLDCIGWQDMRLVLGQGSSPCLNCMGWQDTSLTVAKKDRASSPYLNCVGWQDKSSSRWSFPMSGGMASSPYLNCVGRQDKVTEEVKNHNTLWSASAPFERCRTDLVLVLLRHGRLVDRIEENQKIVIVGVRLVSKFLPTMTLYCTIILDYCRVQLKKKIKKKKSRVGACWSRRFFTTFDMCRLIDFRVVASGQLTQSLG